MIPTFAVSAAARALSVAQKVSPALVKSGPTAAKVLRGSGRFLVEYTTIQVVVDSSIAAVSGFFAHKTRKDTEVHFSVSYVGGKTVDAAKFVSQSAQRGLTGGLFWLGIPTAICGASAFVAWRVVVGFPVYVATRLVTTKSAKSKEYARRVADISGLPGAIVLRASLLPWKASVRISSRLKVQYVEVQAVRSWFQAAEKPSSEPTPSETVDAAAETVTSAASETVSAARATANEAMHRFHADHLQKRNVRVVIDTDAIAKNPKEFGRSLYRSVHDQAGKTGVSAYRSQRLTTDLDEAGISDRLVKLVRAGYDSMATSSASA